MNPRLSILLPLALAAAACGPKLAREQPPAKQPAYVFPHSTHVDSDVACSNCHAPIEKATKLEATVRHIKLPERPAKHKVCSDCHDTDPAIKIAARSRPFRFTFSHADHLPRVKGDCKRCHQDLPEPKETEYDPPPMAACTSCHNHQMDFAQARCTPCHTDLKGYKPESAFRHEGEWLKAHGRLARPSAESCAACHDQTFCAECHSPTTAAARASIVFPERVDRSFIHRGDYVSRHMIDAGADPAGCRRCHGPAFCDACHTQQNLTKAAGNFRDPHPQGWATPGNTPFHGDAARRDISSCAGCHDQGASATCVGCHRVGGVADRPGLDDGPHPPSFISKHRGEDKSKNSICAACHL